MRLPKQRGKFDCGPACLLFYYKIKGEPKSRKQIIKACGTTKENGTDEFGILRALKKFDGPRKALLPFATLLCVDKNQHWCVKVGELPTGHLIYDPETGRLEFWDLKEWNKRTDNGSAYFLPLYL